MNRLNKILIFMCIFIFCIAMYTWYQNKNLLNDIKLHDHQLDSLKHSFNSVKTKNTDDIINSYKEKSTTSDEKLHQEIRDLKYLLNQSKYQDDEIQNEINQIGKNIPSDSIINFLRRAYSSDRR